MLVRVLLAVEEPALRVRLERLLRRRGILRIESASRRTLRDRLARQDVDLVVAGRDALPGSPAEIVTELRRLPEQPELVVVDARDDPEERASLLAAGCLAVIHPRVTDETLAETVLTLARRGREKVVDRLRQGRAERGFASLVSASPVMQRFAATARRLVHADSSLLLLGETGVGKERLARAIHADGPRSAGPFIPVNCGALPEGLLESELFGHEEGAFTGASRSRRGHFELAHQGVLFLDEVGELPLHLQVKLLRALDERRIQRVGSERTLAIDVRVIAATNRDLETEMHAGRFRSDLFFRLAVVTLTLPPLRERREDIPPLVRSSLESFRARMATPVSGVSEEALEALCRYAWPGNVRELINVVEQMMLLCPGTEIAVQDLPRRIQEGRGPGQSGTPATGAASQAGLDLAEGPLARARQQALESFERGYLTGLLRKSGGRIGIAAREAGITPRHLHDMMKRHGLRKEVFKARSSQGPE